MNILFIEDERELRESGVAQLELHRYTVYPVSNLADARAVMEDPAMPVHLVLADQSLPDGQGIQFVIEMKKQFPHCMYTIISGCLTDANTSLLDEEEIPYFRKPLLYGNVVEEFRRKHLLRAPTKEVLPEEPSAEAEAACDESGAVDAAAETGDAAAEAVEAPSPEPESPKQKKWFGLFNK